MSEKANMYVSPRQVPLMDKAGRRLLLLIPMAVMIVDLALLTVTLVYQVRTT